MARHPLMMQDIYRPWVSLGLDCLLLEQDASVASVPVEAKQPTTRQGIQRSGAQKVSPAQGQPESSRSLGSNQQSATATPTINVRRKAALDTSSWPSFWLDAWNRIPERAKVVFTYVELAQDLGGQPSTIRRAFFARLLGSLSWPKGCIAFWPFASETDTIEKGSMYFSSGLTALAPDAVFFFGRSFQLETGCEVSTSNNRPQFLGINLFKVPSLSPENIGHPGFLDHVSTRIKALYSPY